MDYSPKKFIFILIILSKASFSFGQIQIDSLQNQLKKAMPDTSKVLLLDQLAFSLMNSKPTEALNYANEGLTLASKIRFEKGKSRILNRLGTIYRKTNNFGQALQVHLDAIRISEKINDQEGLAKIYINLNGLYIAQNSFEKAIEYGRKALNIGLKLKRNDLSNNALVNIGFCYEARNQLDSAQYYFQKVFDIEKNEKHNKYFYLSKSNIGRIYLKTKNFDLALQNFKEVETFFILEKNDRVLSELYLNMAKVYHGKNQKDSCIFFAKKALQLGNSSQNYLNIYDTSLFISELLENTNPTQALKYYKNAIIAKDSLFSIEKISQMQNVVFQNELKRREFYRSKQEVENNWKFGSLFGLLLALSVILGIQYRNGKIKLKATKTLHKQKIEIEKQKIELENSIDKLKNTQQQLVEQEKLASLGELTAGIAHEIQNPLNFVNNFSEINIDLINEIKNEPGSKIDIELVNDLLNNQEKILHHGNRASNIVKAMLDHSRKSNGQRTKVSINLLADEFVRLSYLGLRSKYKDFNAEYETNFDQNIPEINAVSQDIGRVLLNLLNNAFYAVYDKNEKLKAKGETYNPKVTVTTRLTKANEADLEKAIIEINVKDNGVGIPEAIKSKILQPFFTTKPTGEGTGLGLSLSNDIIVKGHGGTLEIESKIGEGSIFKVKIPIQ